MIVISTSDSRTGLFPEQWIKRYINAAKNTVHTHTVQSRTGCQGGSFPDPTGAAQQACNVFLINGLRSGGHQLFKSSFNFSTSPNIPRLRSLLCLGSIQAIGYLAAGNSRTTDAFHLTTLAGPEITAPGPSGVQFKYLGLWGLRVRESQGPPQVVSSAKGDRSSSIQVGKWSEAGQIFRGGADPTISFNQHPETSLLTASGCKRALVFAPAKTSCHCSRNCFCGRPAAVQMK